MTPPYAHFRQFLSSKNIIIKVMDADFIWTPHTDHQDGAVGFSCAANANANGMKGRIDIRANFLLPKIQETKLTVHDEMLNRIIDNLEFIKTSDRYPMNETLYNIKEENG